MRIYSAFNFCPDFMRCFRLVIGPLFLLSGALLTASGNAANDLQRRFEENFEMSGWEKNWEFNGQRSDAKAGALTSSGGEFTASLTKQFDAPALRIEYEATMLATDASSQFGDLSCFIGPAFFQVGGGYNTVTQIKEGNTASGDFGVRIVLGKTYRIAAEVNSLACRLSVDGKLAGQFALAHPTASIQIRLYTWAGTAQFDNLRVFTKTEADPMPDELKQRVEF